VDHNPSRALADIAIAVRPGQQHPSLKPGYHKAQTTLMRALQAAAARQIESTGPDMRVLLQATSAKASYAWLLAVPQQDCEDDLTLDNTDLRIALALRLGTSPAHPDLAKHLGMCPCERVCLADNPSHALACKHNQGFVTQRHDQVVATLARYARIAELPCKMEPSGTELQGQPHNKPDLRITLANKRTYVDARIVNCLAPSNRARALTQLAVADKAAKDKTTKWAPKANAVGATFVPFVAETPGGLHKQAVGLIKAIAAACSDYAMYSRLEMLTTLTQAVAVAIQRGNARILKEAWRRDQEGPIRLL